MSQHVALEKGTGTSYYALLVFLLLALGGCQKGLKSIAPIGLAPTEPSTVREWLTVYAPRTWVRYDLHWSYRNDRGAAGGRASVRIAPPDSLRFDFRGPLGKSGSALIVGDSGVWAKPEADFRDILRAAPLFWAALGIPRGPTSRMTVSGLSTPERRAWRYAAAVDTFDFVEVHLRPARLLAEMRRGGRIVGVSDALFNDAGDHVLSSRLDFPGAQSRFSFTVDSLAKVEAFGPETWLRP